MGPETLSDISKNYMMSLNIPLLTWYMCDEIGTFALQKEIHAQGTPQNQVSWWSGLRQVATGKKSYGILSVANLELLHNLACDSQTNNKLWLKRI